MDNTDTDSPFSIFPPLPAAPEGGGGFAGTGAGDVVGGTAVIDTPFEPFEPFGPSKPVPPPFPPKPRVRRSKSALLYLRVLDARGVRGRGGASGCPCSARQLGEAVFGPPVKFGSRMGEPSWVRYGRPQRDRRYGMPKRYGMKTTVTTRRVDRVDPVRELY